MPCLIKDRTGRSAYYYCAYTTPDGRRLKKSTKQTDKAKAWEVCLTFVNAEGAIATHSATEQQLRKVINDALARLGERTLTDPTVKEQIDTWIESKKGAVGAATMLAYRQARDLFLEYLGARANRSVRLLAKKDVVAFRDHLLSEGRTPSTVNKITKKYLTGPMESARKEGLVDYNPFVAADALKAKKVDKDYFRPEQVARLTEVVKGMDWEGAILAGYTTGARLQDIANMKWTSVDTVNCVIRFTERKGDKPVLVGLHPDLKEWIEGQKASDDTEAFLFPSLANRSGAGRNGLSKNFESIMKRAGIEGQVLRSADRKGRSVRSLSFHSFRHGAASQVFNAAALKDIARRVTGHAAKGSIDQYLHDNIEAIRAATDMIPRLPKNSI